MSIDQGRHRLGVDFGTSNTVAVARWPDGRARPILVDGSPLLPSAVYAQPDGLLVVGRDAVHSARRDPARFEPNPKRHIDDGLVLLGDREFPVVDLVAAVLVRVAEEWHRAVGPVRPEVTLTCPATWGATRRSLLAEAAARAGLEGARLVAEPVAAATYFADVLGRDVPIGSVVVVHDFGAGTFDASVVARTAEGFEVLAVDGRDDVGGLDVDAAIVDHLGELCAAQDPDAWRRLTEPETLEDRRAQRQLWDDARIAKERLSRTQSADVMVPLLDAEMHVTRDELEELARPVLEQTVRVTRDLLRWADLPDGRLAGVFLVGGASRIPLVATLLHRELGEAPVAIEQPELVVAEGSILADAALLATEPAAPGPTAELRLVSRGDRVRVQPTSPPAPPSPPPPVSVDDMETVPTARRDVTGAFPPAVDPWPDAPQHWAPDPDATVAAPNPVASLPGPAVHPGRSLPTDPPGTSSAPPRKVSSRPVSPAAAATSRSASGSRSRPVSGSGSVAGSGSTSGSVFGSSPAAGAARPATGARPAAGVARPAAGAARPVSGARPSGTARPTATARWDGPEAAPAARVRRRTGRGLRAIQLLLSVVLLVSAPVAAMLVAYSITTGVPVESTVRLIVNDIQRFVG
ncbi:Hsp70 family protein [Couchioplanes caeruleus]|uniref:Hsp70 family protein n=1 Tax=Couchioplanes caeruleus TaxID=56438 RepID=UPI0023DF3173|nr:Hsp70 family protein [Couchioplanes caeruleus]